MEVHQKVFVRIWGMDALDSEEPFKQFNSGLTLCLGTTDGHGRISSFHLKIESSLLLSVQRHLQIM